jgi:hypothetical protein
MYDDSGIEARYDKDGWYIDTEDKLMIKSHDEATN